MTWSFFLEFQDQFSSHKTRYPYAIHSEHFLQSTQLHELFNTSSVSVCRDCFLSVDSNNLDLLFIYIKSNLVLVLWTALGWMTNKIVVKVIKQNHTLQFNLLCNTYSVLGITLSGNFSKILKLGTHLLWARLHIYN